MPHDVACQAFNVVWRDEVSPGQKGMSTCGPHQGDGRAGLAPSSRSGANGRPKEAGSRVARTRSTIYSFIDGAIRMEAASRRNSITSPGP